MTTKEFKDRYPQYAHLEGDTLWDKMTEKFAELANTLYADPDQEKVFHEPIKIDVLQKDYSYVEQTFMIEDSSTTRWLGKDGNLVRIGEIPMSCSNIPKVSYSGVVWDVNDSGAQKEL